MSEPTKTCTKCGKELPATPEFFYRHPSGKLGVTPRCKLCVNEDNKHSHACRMQREPEKLRAQANDRAKRSYQKDLEKSRARQRAHQAARRADPEKALVIRARKRAGGSGLTPDQLEALFQSQGCVCAICGADKPGSKNGWNVDHCHTTGHVRFVLCAHCNRGLGAFKDTPAILRKAADMLEAFYPQNQENRPVKAIKS